MTAGVLKISIDDSHSVFMSSDQLKSLRVRTPERSGAGREPTPSIQDDLNPQV
jgi:hypothetical protein